MWIVEKLLNFELQIHKKFIFLGYVKELLTLNFPACKKRFSYKETGVSLKSDGQLANLYSLVLQKRLL